MCSSTMLKHRYSIGGEQSGHVIFLDFATTGDGQLTAVQLLGVMKRSGKKVSELASCMEVFPAGINQCACVQFRQGAF